MRKIVKKPDGTEEILEGTPEEIAELERQREGVKKPPEVLKGTPDDSQMQQFLDAIERLKQTSPPISPWPQSPIWIVSCTQCQCYPCVCQYWWRPGLTCASATWSSADPYEAFLGG